MSKARKRTGSPSSKPDQPQTPPAVTTETPPVIEPKPSKKVTMTVLRDFDDLRAGKRRHTGEQFEVSQERAKEILAHKDKLARLDAAE